MKIKISKPQNEIVLLNDAGRPAFDKRKDNLIYFRDRRSLSGSCFDEYPYLKISVSPVNYQLNETESLLSASSAIVPCRTS